MLIHIINMEIRMKRLLGLVVVFAVLVLVSYYGMGLLTEKTIKDDVQIINQYQGVHIDIPSYKREWFTSNANFNWTINVPERVVKDQQGQAITIPAQTFKLNMPLKIFHGPIIFADKGVHFGLGYGHTRLNLPAEYEKQFNEFFTAESTKPHLDVGVLVNYLNKSTLEFDLPKFTLVSQTDKSKFEWLGMQKEVTISSNLSTVAGEFVIDGLRFTKAQTQATIGKITSDYDLKQSPEGLYVGDAKISLPSIVVNEANKKIFELVNYSIKADSSVTSGLLDISFDTQLDKVQAQDKVYGPGILKLLLKNLDAKVFAYINTQANKMQHGTEEEKQQAMMALLPELPKLFSKGVRFEIAEMRFTLPEGTTEGNLWVQFPKEESSNPFQMMQKLEGEGQVKLPIATLHMFIFNSEKQQLSKPSIHQAMVNQMEQDQAKVDAATPTDAPTSATPAAENQATPDALPVSAVLTPQEIDEKARLQTEQKLGVLEQSGMIRRQDKDYIIELKLANGQLTINGQPFNPSTMHF
jgi:uncharacterized protein YdgA (DUF945 family)